MGEETLKEAKERANWAEGQLTKVMRDKESIVAKAKVRVIEEFRTSANFEAKVLDAMLQAFGYSFEACWAQAR